VIAACARTPRPGQRGTWITPAMQAAYIRLHELGHAHSVEVFEGEDLAGGIYGVAVGRMFFGESMFSARSGGSKVALAALAATLRRWGWPLIDAQVESAHLVSLGAGTMPRAVFLRQVAELVAEPGRTGPWTDPFGTWPASRLAGADGFVSE
jgi:leucyl/phenylalanyl-tRNA--protein transferase